VHDSLMAGEMSQHERASSWLDQLPSQMASSSGDAGPARGRCAAVHGGGGGADLAETRSDGGGAHDPGSRTVSYDKYAHTHINNLPPTIIHEATGRVWGI